MTASGVGDVRVGPLADLRVLDLSRFIAGPYCTMMLGDMGADVVRIEAPGRPESTRSIGAGPAGQSYYFAALNRNKRAVTVDLRAVAGKQLILELVSRADVLVENYRPGTLESMGLSPEVLHDTNPRLVLTRISGFGQTGPYAGRLAYDAVAQAMSGLMWQTGDALGPPTMTGAFVCDYSTGLYALSGILAALHARFRTGKGQVVDACLLDSAVAFLLTAIPEAALDGTVVGRNGNRDRFSVPSGTFRTGDGDWLLISGGDDQMFPRLCAAIERPDLAADPRFATFAGRRAAEPELEAAVSDWVGGFSTAEAIDRLEAAGVPAAPVNTAADVAADPHLRGRDQIVDVTQPGGDTVPTAGVTVRLSDTPLTIRRPVPSPGEHTAEVLSDWLRLPAAAIDDLVTSGTV